MQCIRHCDIVGENSCQDIENGDTGSKFIQHDERGISIGLKVSRGNHIGLQDSVLD